MRRSRTHARAAVHGTAQGVRSAGLIANQAMHRFDPACPTAVRRLPFEESRALRAREHASQAVVADYLNVTTSLVSQWERGEKRPQGASLRLLAVVAKHGLATVARRGCRRAGASVQIPQMLGVPPFGRGHETGRCHPHRMQPAFEVTLPELEKPVQHRELRRHVVILPDIGLQDGRMIRHMV
jgi:putative transcriptional regulator